jgi:hypothetical protein
VRSGRNEQGAYQPDVSDADLDARLSAMIEGQRYAAAGDWDAVAAEAQVIAEKLLSQK